MRTAWFLVSVIVLLSCGSFLRGSSNNRAQTVPAQVLDPEERTCSPQEEVTALIADLERCKIQVAALQDTDMQTKHMPVEKVITKIEKRRCADDGPVIKPVPTTKCMSGQLCIDDEGQRVLAKNMAAYEAWVQRIKDCEAK